MNPLDLMWAVLIGVAILAAVGAPLAWAAGLRGFWIAAAAAPFALTLIGGTAVVAPWIGIPWSILPVLLLTVVIGTGIFFLRRRFAAGPLVARTAAVDGWLIAALLVAALLIGVRVLQIIGAPGNISQTFDDIFHLNGVRFVLNEGNASSLHLGYMTSPGGTLPFYPAGWHAFTSLIVQLSGSTIPIAVNAVTLVVSGAIWPASAVILARTLFGPRPAVTVSAALLSASIPAFPFLLMDYGVLYPFQLGLALTPFALAATYELLRLPPYSAARVARPRQGRQGDRWWWGLVLLGVIPGMTIAHPGAFVAWLALSVPMVAVFAWRAYARAATRRRRVLIAGSVIAYLGAGLVLVRVLRPPAEARGWPIQMSIPEAMWQIISVSAWYLVPAIGVGAAVVLGIIWALIDRTRASLIALAMYLIGAMLFVTVASLPLTQLRDILTGSWYNNLPRLAAVSVLPMVSLGAYGLARSWSALASIPRLRRLSASVPPLARVAVATVVAAVVALALQGAALQRTVEWASPQYRLDANSALLTRDEYALLERVDQTVPEGVAIAGSPWTGASLAFAIANRSVLMPHTLMDVSRTVETINDGLDTAEEGGSVCRAVSDLEVGFVLDFGRQEVHPGEHSFPGFDELADSDSVRLVDSEGQARLYEIVGCG